MNSKWKNYGLWVSMAALIALLLPQFGISVDMGQYQKIVDLILGILSAAGIISSPTVGKWYLDAVKETDKAA